MPIAALIPLLSAIAPSVIKWIAGDDAGKVAEKVAAVAGQVLGNTDDPRTAFNALPPDKQAELRMALARIEADAEASRRQSELDVLRTEIQDRMDARARDVALVKAGTGNLRSNIMVSGAFIVLIVCVGVVLAYGLKNWALTGEAIAIVSTVATGALACLKDAFGFEFGSSRSSKDKDAVLAKIIQNGH